MEKALVAFLVEDLKKFSYQKEEFLALLKTRGIEAVDIISQRLVHPVPATYFGYGKVQEIGEVLKKHNLNLLAVGGDLTPTQAKNLEELLEVTVVDRTQIILEIFAEHAHTHEGKIQVELARLMYNLPRITGLGRVLSRLGGGIGTRGPGETKLEVLRRTIRKRIADLRRELKEIEQNREVKRSRRLEAGVPIVALVGYTNAGKSTLLNALTGAGVLAEDKLFATLDPTVRKLTLPGGQKLLLTDTVGFIENMPPLIKEAFKSTLEVVYEAELILHVVDGASPYREEQEAVVEKILTEMKVKAPVITVYNKVDLLPEPVLFLGKRAVAISARTGYNIELLLKLIEENLFWQEITVKAVLPFARAFKIGELKENLKLINLEYLPDGIEVTVAGPRERIARHLGREKLEEINGEKLVWT
ncbi:GTP-binding protein HflX [Carboxydothermus islandicus]|uniref:GTPase HflX n=1 Tax=Carboxydothermus islandicus TaxID=661089 RepID=A0A1L8D218_9THEO|nr:GTPase HflX [Carboxydothermus islandicus]GAV25245.1 GTP-binding protein HflX [Carboxydothermus islandicus]